MSARKNLQSPEFIVPRLGFKNTKNIFSEEPPETKPVYFGSKVENLEHNITGLPIHFDRPKSRPSHWSVTFIDKTYPRSKKWVIRQKNKNIEYLKRKEQVKCYYHPEFHLKRVKPLIRFKEPQIPLYIYIPVEPDWTSYIRVIVDL